MFKQLTRRILSFCLLGAMVLGLLPPAQALAAVAPDPSSLRICVISDAHYYPLTYVSDCPDYQNYIGADPKLLAESGAILDEAMAMIAADQPDLILVSGDLTKDGEKQAHLEFAEKMRQLEQTTGAPVFVIDGNHDIYNYKNACTFQNGVKESAETVTPAEFRAIYAEFGYNGEYDAVYYTPPEGKQAGGLSYAVTVEDDYLILALDTCMYSPEATGLETNQQVTGGQVDPDLLAWAVEQIAAAEAEGKTVIGLMHHAILPHFGMEAELMSAFIVNDWEQTASALADAGLRYVFTGHMHANDIAEYTTLNGNHIVDVETGSLSSWGSPVRTVTLEKGEPLNDGTLRTKESITLSSRSVQSITFQGVRISDFPAYTMEHLYPDSMLGDLARGRLAPLLASIGQNGVRATLAELVPGLDLNEAILQKVQDALLGGKQLELGWGIGRVYASYRDGAIHLAPSGNVGLVGEIVITDEEIIAAVDDLMAQFEDLCLYSPDLVLNRIESAAARLSETGVAQIGTEDEKSFYDLMIYTLLSHDAGGENAPDWVKEARQYIQSGKIVSNIIEVALEEVVDLAEDLATHLLLDPAILLGEMWTKITGVETSLLSVLKIAGFDLRALLDSLVGEYMSESFLSGMGGLLDEMAGSMIEDEVQDDQLDGESRTILFEGAVEKPAPTAENGLLPDQITLTLGSDAETGRAFSWYTGVLVETGAVQLSTSPDMSGAEIIPAQSARVERPYPLMNLGLFTTYTTKTVQRHTAAVEGLEPNTTYYYRVGCPEKGYWSEIVSFTTGDPDSDSFTFLNLNDSQGMIRSDYDAYHEALALARQTFPEAEFLVHAGDFVDDGSNENYWTMVLDSADAQALPTLPAAGNHENRSSVAGVTEPNALMSHFNLQNLPEQDTSTGVYYSFEYQNAAFIVLNTNDLGEGGGLSQAQFDWACRTAAETDAQWKILLLHKSPYSNGPHAEDDDVEAIRAQVNQLAAEYDIDLVLSGHDHVYNRTPWLNYGKVQNTETRPTSYNGQSFETAFNPGGTVFVTAGTAGVKNYTQTLLAEVPSALALDLDCPVYAGVTLAGGRLYYQAYKVENGQSILIDSFAIDKTGEDALPAWRKAETLIEALPEIPGLENAGAVEAARAAYEALSPEEQAQISCGDKLAQAEKILAAQEAIQAGRTVTASTKAEFVAALENPVVTTIEVAGTIEFEDCWGEGREYEITRDLCLRGGGVLRYVEFKVKNGATLILDDSLYINDTRSRGFAYRALDPVEIYADSTLITRGSVQLRTEFGTGGAEVGHAIKLMESGAAAYLNSVGIVWGAEGAVYSPAAGTRIVINHGTYGRKNGTHYAVETRGVVEINGGTIRNLRVKPGGTLYMNGGELDNGREQSARVPLCLEGAAYLSGGTIKAHLGEAVNLKDSGKLHILTSGQGVIDLGGLTPWVGGIQTEGGAAAAAYCELNGFGGADGIYRTTVAANIPAEIAAAGGEKLPTTAEGGRMTAQIPAEGGQLYARYDLVGEGKTAPSVFTGTGGSARVSVYGPTRLVEAAG